MICSEFIRFWKPQLCQQVHQGLSGQLMGEAHGRERIGITPLIRGEESDRLVCGKFQTRDDNLSCGRSQWARKTEHISPLSLYYSEGWLARCVSRHRWRMALPPTPHSA